MGNSTGSMFFMAVILIAAYLVGMLLFEGCRFIRRRLEERKGRRFGGDRGQGGI